MGKKKKITSIYSLGETDTHLMARSSLLIGFQGQFRRISLMNHFLFSTLRNARVDFSLGGFIRGIIDPFVRPLAAEKTIAIA